MRSKSYPLGPAIIGALGIVSGAASAATTLTFEDLDPSPAAYDVMPGNYNGLTFTGFYFGPDTLYTPASGTIDLFTDYADPADPSAYVVTSANNSITSATPFVFDGATFSGYSGVTFLLYSGGSLVHTSTSIADAPAATPYAPTFLASGYALPVDTVRVSGVQGYYSMDDVVFSPSAVPEPAAWTLMAFGLAGVLGFAGSRKR